MTAYKGLPITLSSSGFGIWSMIELKLQLKIKITCSLMHCSVPQCQFLFSVEVWTRYWCPAQRTPKTNKKKCTSRLFSAPVVVHPLSNKTTPGWLATDTENGNFITAAELALTLGFSIQYCQSGLICRLLIGNLNSAWGSLPHTRSSRTS